MYKTYVLFVTLSLSKGWAATLRSGLAVRSVPPLKLRYFPFTSLPLSSGRKLLSLWERCQAKPDGKGLIIEMKFRSPVILRECGGPDSII